MAAYSYKALDRQGAVNKGVLEGDSERHVRNQLRARHLQPLEVEPAISQSSVPGISFTGPRSLPPAEVITTIRQLSVLVLAGVPLEEALGATARHTPREAMKNLVMQVRTNVLSGQSLAASLAAFPRDFPRMTLAMVRAGEHAGLLGEVLDALADHGERRLLMQQKLKMALIYPAALLLVATAVVVLLLVFVMPQLVELFDQTSTTLPLMTRMLLGLGAFLSQWGWSLPLLGVLAFFSARHYLQDGRRAWFDRAVLQLPVAGSLMGAADAARFTSTLSILVKSGVALVEAIRIAADVMDNRVLAAKASSIAATVEEGGSLARAMEQTQLFSPMLVQLVASGESSGTLDTMLSRAAHNQETDLGYRLDGLVKIMEPLVIILMSLVVGAIVLSVLFPILQMNSLVG
jgi:general secretion pathway protein F